MPCDSAVTAPKPVIPVLQRSTCPTPSTTSGYCAKWPRFSAVNVLRTTFWQHGAGWDLMHCSNTFCGLLTSTHWYLTLLIHSARHATLQSVWDNLGIAEQSRCSGLKRLCKSSFLTIATSTK